MRIRTAGEHEVLPYQYAVAVCLVVELVVLVDASTPHTQHIHVGSLHVLKYAFVSLLRHVWQQGVVGNEVGTLCKHRLAVHHEVERLAVLVVVHHHSHRAQPHIPLLLRYLHPVYRQRCRKLIQRRFAPTVGHPQMRLLNAHRQTHRIGSRAQLYLFSYLFRVAVRVVIIHLQQSRDCAGRDIVYLQPIVYIRLSLRHRILTYIVVLYPCHIRKHQAHRSPYSTRSQAYAPVPSV